MKTREDVWEAFADQFLDTETRMWIPRAALTAFEAGLSRAEAYDAWRFEVTPAVGSNLWAVAGEWACWDRAWLVERVERGRLRPSRAARLSYRLEVLGFHARWIAIDACMAALERTTAPKELTDSLSWLAHHFFDFCGSDRAPATRTSLERLYTTFFAPTFRPLVFASDGFFVGCDSRVMRALARIESNGPYRTP